MVSEMSESKRKEQTTRAALGPRLGHAKKGGHRVIAAPARPRATGAPSSALRDGNEDHRS